MQRPFPEEEAELKLGLEGSGERICGAESPFESGAGEVSP